MTLTPEIIYEQSKFWLGLITFIWSIFKGFSWVRDIRDKDLKGLHEGIVSLRGDLQGQTTQLVEQIKELRNDVRYSSHPRYFREDEGGLSPARSRPARKTPARKRAAKKANSSVIELTLDK
jgi:hypothetical protein